MILEKAHCSKQGLNTMEGIMFFFYHSALISHEVKYYFKLRCSCSALYTGAHGPADTMRIIMLIK